MSETQHTPGPWYFLSDQSYVREESTDATIARICEDDGHVDPKHARALPYEANARLIAAAPAMRDLLETLASGNSDYDDLTDRAATLLDAIDNGDSVL